LNTGRQQCLSGGIHETDPLICVNDQHGRGKRFQNLQIVDSLGLVHLICTILVHINSEQAAAQDNSGWGCPAQTL
jgi:hypothetical protein